jgi:cell division protein FtsW (lipid II flippase)
MLRMQEPDIKAALLIVALATSTLVCALALPRWGLVDPFLVTLMNFLCSLGVLFQYSLNQTMGGLSHAWFYLAGMLALLVASFVIRLTHSFKRYRLALFIGAIALLGVTLTHPVFRYNGSSSWIPLRRSSEGVMLMSIQPSEFVKLILIVLLADILSDQTIGRAKRLLMSVCISIAFVGLICLQNDFGTALLYFLTALCLIYIGLSDIRILISGCAAGVGAALVIYRISTTVQDRVRVLIDPFKEAADKGFQLVQSLIAIANGGTTGMGLGLGRAGTIPLYDTDFVFSAICEQFGIVFGLCVMFIYVLMFMRGMRMAARATRRFHALLAAGCSSMLAVQTFVIIGGVIKMIPLTGVTLPFLSLGGSSMISCMAQIGILCGVHACVERDFARSRRAVEPIALREGLSV